MRKIIFSINVTLDGLIDHTAGVADHELLERTTALLNTTDLLLCGRAMYQLLSTDWPDMVQNPDITPSELEFGNRINGMPKLVFSRTLDQVGWNSQLVRHVDAAEILKLKQQPGKDMLLCGANLASSFMQLGLIDQYQLWVHPVVLGSGKSLFKGLKDKLELKLAGISTLNSGVVVLDYQPKK